MAYTVEIPQINWEKDIPSCFDEMTTSDYLLFARLYLRLLNSSINLNYLKTEMTYQFMGIRHNKYQYERLDQETRDSINANIWMISEHLNYLFTEETIEGEKHLKINLDFTKNLIPRYHNFVGFADFLEDLTFQEYKDAHVAAMEYMENQNPYDLNHLVAILYRKPLFRWMKKPPYNPGKVEQNILKVGAWPIYVKYAIYLNFLSCEKYLREGTFRIDNQDISFSILFKSDGESSGSGAGLTGLLYNLAETGVFGNVKETSQQNLFDVMFRLWQVTTEARQRKRNAKHKTTNPEQ